MRLGEGPGDIEDTPIRTTLDELRESLGEAHALWAIYHRGAEGISEEELVALLNIWPNPKWVAIYIADPQAAATVLRAGVFDPAEDQDET